MYEHDEKGMEVLVEVKEEVTKDEYRSIFQLCLRTLPFLTVQRYRATSICSQFIHLCSIFSPSCIFNAFRAGYLFICGTQFSR